MPVKKTKTKALKKDSKKETKEKQNSTKVLIVEDDAFISEMYNTKLILEGFDVYLGHDGEEGIEMAVKVLPEIILLDILMPKKDGFEVLEFLKGEEKTRNIPVIILSNMGQKQEIDKGLSLGATTYLIKAHYMPSEIVDKIKEVLTKEEVF